MYQYLVVVHMYLYLRYTIRVWKTAAHAADLENLLLCCSYSLRYSISRRTPFVINVCSGTLSDLCSVLSLQRSRRIYSRKTVVPQSGASRPRAAGRNRLIQIKYTKSWRKQTNIQNLCCQGKTSSSFSYPATHPKKQEIFSKVPSSVPVTNPLALETCLSS